MAGAIGLIASLFSIGGSAVGIGEAIAHGGAPSTPGTPAAPPKPLGPTGPTASQIAGASGQGANLAAATGGGVSQDYLNTMLQILDPTGQNFGGAQPNIFGSGPNYGLPSVGNSGPNYGIPQ